MQAHQHLTTRAARRRARRRRAGRGGPHTRPARRGRGHHRLRERRAAHAAGAAAWPRPRGPGRRCGPGHLARGQATRPLLCQRRVGLRRAFCGKRPSADARSWLRSLLVLSCLLHLQRVGGPVRLTDRCTRRAARRPEHRRAAAPGRAHQRARVAPHRPGAPGAAIGGRAGRAGRPRRRGPRLWGRAARAPALWDVLAAARRLGRQRRLRR